MRNLFDPFCEWYLDDFFYMQCRLVWLWFLYQDTSNS